MTVFGFEVDWKIFLASLLAMLLVFVILFKSIYRILQNRKSLGRFLKKNFYEVVQHAALPDSMGGRIYADFLALDAQGIYVINYMDYPGILFGGDKIDYWTQVIGSKSYRFENPLYHNHLFLNEVRRLVQGVPLKGVLVFSDQGDFPRAKPEEVFLCREFREAYAQKETVPVPGQFLEQWSLLKGQLYQN